MTQWIKGTLESMGYTGVVLLMFVENVFPPIPSEIVMPFSGYTASQGQLALWGVILAGTAGSVLGALPLYYLGKWIGVERLKRWSASHGHWLMTSERDIEKAEGWFEHHGSKTVFFCRFIPGVRSLISIPAGFAEMNMAKFLLWTAAGTGIWAGALAWAGSALGESYDRIGRYLGPASWVVLGGLLVWYVVYVWRRKRQKARA
jgi:membrane protein DedA with SNARE-associated domain